MRMLRKGSSEMLRGNTVDSVLEQLNERYVKDFAEVVRKVVEPKGPSEVLQGGVDWVESFR